MDETPPPATAEHPASPERATSVGSNRRHLAIVLGVALVTLGVDVVAAWLSGSLALMESDAHA
jgi:Co/Zn/Cd efflux system component